MSEHTLAARILVEYWKTLRSYRRTIPYLPPGKADKSVAQLNYSEGRLQALASDAGLSIVTFEGQPFTANLPAVPVNAEDFAGTDGLFVESTLEPAVVSDGQVISMGKIVLGGTHNVSGD